MNRHLETAFTRAMNALSITADLPTEIKAVRKEHRARNKAGKTPDFLIAGRQNHTYTPERGVHTVAITAQGATIQLDKRSTVTRILATGDYAVIRLPHSRKPGLWVYSSGAKADVEVTGEGHTVCTTGRETIVRMTRAYHTQVVSVGAYSNISLDGGINSDVLLSGDGSRLALTESRGARVIVDGIGCRVSDLGDGTELLIKGSKNRVISDGTGVAITVTGDGATVVATGHRSSIAGVKGTCITLADHSARILGSNCLAGISALKTTFIDGVILKENTPYCLCGGQFREYIKYDGLACAVLAKHGSIRKITILESAARIGLPGTEYDKGRRIIAFVAQNAQGICAHGSSPREAMRALQYKIGNRDTTVYKDWTPDTHISREDAIRSYRVITGACEYGTRSFVDALSASGAPIPELLTPRLVADMTKGAWGNPLYREFFKIPVPCAPSYS